jgi:hypothetical protein
MHCRVITQDDHLILLAEARRIFRAFEDQKDSVDRVPDCNVFGKAANIPAKCRLIRTF